MSRIRTIPPGHMELLMADPGDRVLLPDSLPGVARDTAIVLCSGQRSFTLVGPASQVEQLAVGVTTFLARHGGRFGSIVRGHLPDAAIDVMLRAVELHAADDDEPAGPECWYPTGGPSYG